MATFSISYKYGKEEKEKKEEPEQKTYRQHVHLCVPADVCYWLACLRKIL
jgi:hypothetical protein